jgi:hypothetical protein
MRIAVLTVAAGLSVAGTGCPTLDLGDAPVPPGSCNPDPAYFRDVIWTEYINTADSATNCVTESGCHSIDDGKSALRLEIVTDPGDIAAHDRNYRVVKTFLNCGSPDLSLMLVEPLSGEQTHGGGDLFAPGSAQEQVFLAWFGM